MPKTKKKSFYLIHPNSRKAAQIVRSHHKNKKRDLKVHDKATRLDVALKKFLWFQENLDPDLPKYEDSNLTEIVSKYLSRFDEELEQIRIIQSIGRRNPTQHTARERAITLTKERELMLLQSTGLEIPDLRSQETVRLLSEWEGDAKSIPKFEIMKYNNYDVIASNNT